MPYRENFIVLALLMLVTLLSIPAAVESSTPDPRPKNNVDQVIIKVLGEHAP